MDRSDTEDRALIDFLTAYAIDRERGRPRPLSEYLRRSPEHELEIARQYLELQRSSSRDWGARIGRYLLVEEAGRGGQGVVYRAVDESLSRTVALKVLHGRIFGGHDARLRLAREAQITSRLEHPSICPVYEVGEDGPHAFLALRWIEGESLAARLRGIVERGAPPPDAAGVAAWCRLIEKAARGVDAAHQAGVVHRDLKPANLMIGRDGEPVVLDFGLARDDDAERLSLTLSGEVLGTPSYMAPEQLKDGTRSAGRAADVYALGAILYECVAGRPPHRATTVHSLVHAILTRPASSARGHNPAVSRDLEVVLSTALDPDPGRRYATAADFADDLARIRRREPIRARRTGPFLRARRALERRPWVAIAASVIVVLLTAMFHLARSMADARVARARERSGRELVFDNDRAVELLNEIDESLWPIEPALAPRGATWTANATRVIASLPAHDAFVKAEGARDDGAYPRWLQETLSRLRRNTSDLARRSPEVEERLRRLDALSRETAAAAPTWDECRAAIRDDPRFRGLDLESQVGLVPLGPNAAGLWEFWHVDSGERPRRDEAGAVASERSGVVLVLLPGGDFAMGSDGRFRPQEIDVGRVEVALAPFFLSKFEVTHAQWRRYHDDDPSMYPPGKSLADEVFSFEHSPVENVTWSECSEATRRMGLTLPTEAQWDYAARAGTDTPYWWGVTSLDDHANFHGREANDVIEGAAVRNFADRHPRTAPVGSYPANPLGIHDMHGNVREWMRDGFVEYSKASPRRSDGELSLSALGSRLDVPANSTHGVLRGGSFMLHPYYGAAERRHKQLREDRSFETGLRPARGLGK